MMFKLIFTAYFLVCSFAVTAAPLRVAVASNFLITAKVIAKEFEKNGHQVELISGSTGKLYAQIINEAPFDVFMSADRESVEQLQAQNKISTGSNRLYAVGKLALWFPKGEGDKTLWLKNAKFNRLGIANPKIAPYGKAALSYLQKVGMYEALKEKLVETSNINLSFFNVEKGLVDAGFVASSALIHKGIPNEQWEIVNTDLQLEQHMGILKNAPDPDLAWRWFEFVNSEAMNKVKQRDGYEVLVQVKGGS